MLDALKKTVLAGIGATVITAEKAEKALKEFVDKGKISAEDARKMAEKLAEDGKTEYEAARVQIQGIFSDFLKKAKMVSEDDYKSLEERVTVLEEKLKSSGKKPSGTSPSKE